MQYAVNNMRFNFLYIDTYSFNKDWVFLEAVAPYSMLRYIEKGSGTFFIDGEEIRAEKDCIAYIPQG
ncbi:MAG: AraC family ligand binding domain-containing protein, partial [Lachnospiraceae bacterium]|nr:AraC family ligand binding domain-containing protein [Lachnospiraceae bacterium]